MSQKDKKKWNQKYQQMQTLLEPRPPSKFLTQYYKFTKTAKALDLACGSGRHSIFLAEKGFEVDGIDISSVALETLAKRVKKLPINLIEADLDNYELPKEHYNLIIKTNFLDKSLINKAKKALKKGGIFIIETYMKDQDNEKKDSNQNFLLQKEELKSFFDTSFEILTYQEFWNESYEKYKMKKQAIVVKKLSTPLI